MPSGKVRGITIELAADASGLLRGIKQTNSAIKRTGSELRDVDKLLKLDPKNMNLLRQRTQLLQTQIGQTRTKLQQLQQAQAQLKAEGADRSSEQFRALEREIEDTERKLKELESTAGSGSAAMLRFSDAMGSAGQKMTAAGEKLMPLTAGIAGLAGVAVKTAADFEQQMSKVQAISGATAEDMQTLEAKAREMGEKTKFSAAEVGQGYEYMAMAGWKTSDMLSGIEGILNLAAASGEELGTTSDIVTDALTAFGLGAEDAGHFADVLAAASSNANTNVGMLGESFKYVAPVAGALGFSVEDITTALGLMANSGIKASSAGTTLRSLLSRMAKPTDEVAAAMETLGVSLDDGQGNMKSFGEIMQDLRQGFKGLKTPEADALKALKQLDKELEDGTITEEQYNSAVADWMKTTYGAEGALKAEAAATLAGQKGMSGLLAIVNASDEDFSKLTGAITDSEGAAGKMAETMQDNLAGQITILKSQLQELAISFGKLLMPIIKKVVGKIQDLVQKFNNLDDGTKKTILKIAGLVAAIAPALIVFGKLATAISAVTKVMSTAKFTTFITNPLTLAVGAIGGVIGAWKLYKDAIRKAYDEHSPFAKTLDDLQERTNNLAGALKDAEENLDGALSDADVQASQAHDLASKIFELASAEEKTAGQKEALKQLVGELNGIMPDLNLKYDEERDILNKTNGEILTYIGLKKKQAEADAWGEFYASSVKNRIQAERDMAEATNAYRTAVQMAEPDLKRYLKRVEDGVATADDARVANWRWGAQLDELNDLRDTAKKSIDNYQKAVEDETKSEKGLSKATQEVADTKAEMEKELNSLNLKDFRDEVKETLGKDFTSELEDAINNAAKAGAEIPDELKQGLLSGEIDVKTATEQINKIVRDTLAKNREPVKAEATTQGTGYSDSLAATKTKAETATNTVKNAVITAFKAAVAPIGKIGTATGGEYSNKMSSTKGKAATAANGVQGAAQNEFKKGIAPAGGNGGATGGSYGGGILSKKDLVGANASTLTQTALNNLGADGYKKGAELALGYAKGIADNAAAAATEAINMVWGAITGIQNAQNSHSPSKVAAGLGRDFGEGYEIGISKEAQAAAAAAAGLAQTAISGLSGARAAFAGINTGLLQQNAGSAAITRPATQTTNNNITVTVNGTKGQDVNALANAVIYKIQTRLTAEGAAHA